MSALTDTQWSFLQDVAKLIEKIPDFGLTASFGETWRTPVQAWINSLPAMCTLVGLTVDGKEMHFPDHVGGVGIQTIGMFI